MKRWAVGLVLLTAAIPAGAQDTGLRKLFDGKEIPYSLKLKELGPEWRCMVLHSAAVAPKSSSSNALQQLMQLGMMAEAGKKGAKKDDAAASALGMSMLGSLFGGGSGGETPEEPLTYTKGQVLTLGGQPFLVAYRVQEPTVDLAQMMKDSQKSGKEPDPSELFGKKKLTEESNLAVVLVNLTSIASISDLRPFDMKHEIEASEKAAGGGLADLFKDEPKEEPEGPDPFLVPAIEGAFRRDAQLKGTHISVSLSKDVVVLKGTAASASARAHAVNVAQKVIRESGEEARVVSQVQVSPPKRK